MYCGRRVLLTCRMAGQLGCAWVEGLRGVLPAEDGGDALLATTGCFCTTCRQHDATECP